MNQRIESPQARAWVNQPFSDPDTRQFVQNVLVRMDELVNRFQRTPSDQFAAEEVQLHFTGTETTGQVVQQKRNLGFKARTCIAFNTSGHEIDLGYGMLIPANVANYVFRVQPARDIYSISVYLAGSTSGDLHLILTEEVIPPCAGVSF